MYPSPVSPLIVLDKGESDIIEGDRPLISENISVKSLEEPHVGLTKTAGLDIRNSDPSSMEELSKNIFYHFIYKNITRERGDVDDGERSLFFDGARPLIFNGIGSLFVATEGFLNAIAYTIIGRLTTSSQTRLLRTKGLESAL